MVQQHYVVSSEDYPEKLEIVVEEGKITNAESSLKFTEGWNIEFFMYYAAKKHYIMMVCD